MKFTIAQKLIASFLTLILLLTTMAVAVYVTLSSNGRLERRLTQERQPAVLAASQALGNVHRAFASLRGYMLLGDASEASERQAAWSEVNASLDALDRCTAHWTPAERQELVELRDVLRDMESIELEIEQVSHTAENYPARQILARDAAPKATSMLSAVTAMIDEESSLHPTVERRQLLTALANSRGSLAVGLSSIRAFLLTGDETWARDFAGRWETNTKAFHQLQQTRSIMTLAQQRQLSAYTDARTEFAPLPGEMFALRRSPGWNRANLLYREKLAPRAAVAQRLVEALVERQSKSLSAEAEQLRSAQSHLRWGVAIAAILGVIAATALAWFVTRSILRGIATVTNRLQQIAEGEADLTRRVEHDRDDELGHLTQWFNRFVSRIHDLVAKLADDTSVLQVSSAGLVDTAANLSQQADSSKERSASVASASEELTVTMSEMAQSSQRMSTSMESVTSSIAEMTEAIANIVSKTNESAAIAQHATEQMTESSGKVGELGVAAGEIGGVIEVIQDIAEQTNLLALNATIEAARAGEAGKGFAVVATEVKELAKQTAAATDDIRRRIRTIQGSADEAVESMQSIRGVISQVDEVAKQIANSVAQQQTSTEQIANSVAASAQSSKTIANGVAQSADVSREISHSILEVDKVLVSTVESAAKSAAAGSKLSSLATGLTTLVGEFHVDSSSTATASSE